jgi:ribosome-binding factor A
MQETRRMKLQALIRQQLVALVPQEIKDPRVVRVTFTSVNISPNGAHARILVRLNCLQALEGQATSETMKDCLAGLNSASGYLRNLLGKILSVRHVPQLAFEEDVGFENAIKVESLLKSLSC